MIGGIFYALSADPVFEQALLSGYQVSVTVSNFPDTLLPGMTDRGRSIISGLNEKVIVTDKLVNFVTVKFWVIVTEKSVETIPDQC